jgi:hypothetical protein
MWTRSVVADLDVVTRDCKFFILIPSRFPPIALFKRIANDRDAEVSDIESQTNPRLRERERLLSGARVVDVDSPLIQNWNHAPFTYGNPEGSRFFGPERPALDLADDLQTALVISVRKRETFLRRTKEEPMGLDMRVLSRQVRGRFVNGLGWEPNLDLMERRKRGAQVVKADVDGLLFRPPERPTATCVAILNGSALDRAVQGDHFRFVWDGTKITTIYSFSSGRSYSPDQLREPHATLAA